MTMFFRRSTFGAATAALLGFGVAQGVSAAELPTTIYPFPDDASASWVQDALTKKGFTDVQPVEHKGDIYNTTAKWEGRWVRLSLDDAHGGITYEGTGGTVISTAGVVDVDHVRSELQKMGYAQIGEIEHKGDVFSTTALHKGRRIALSVDQDTGSVTQERVIGEQAYMIRNGELVNASGIQTDGTPAIQLPRDWMSLDYLGTQLSAFGFTDVRNLEKQGDVHQLDAKMGGEWHRIAVDARTGAIDVRG